MEVPYGFTWNVEKTLAVADTIEELCDLFVNAVLDTQGRCMQKKFSVEELCEFVAWNGEEITRITKEIMKKLLVHIQS